DGIRDFHVTGVQTCALPILNPPARQKTGTAYRGDPMKIYVTSVFVDDQAKALDFYTRVLGFEKKNDVPLGEASWLTVVSPEDRDGTELLLEPDGHPAVGPYKRALVADG